MITQDQLKAQLHYDPETGNFTWLIPKSTQIKIGDVAGSLSRNGYIRISINWKRYMAHRLAWLYMNGEFPNKQIDHINGNREDNSFLNLRECSNAENQKNRKNQISNKSGFKGVAWDKYAKKWRAQTTFNNKRIHLGLFSDVKEAAESYKNFAKEKHGEFYRAL